MLCSPHSGTVVHKAVQCGCIPLLCQLALMEGAEAHMHIVTDQGSPLHVAFKARWNFSLRRILS